MIRRFQRWMRFQQSYRSEPPWDTRNSPPELIEFVQTHPAGRALDIGCGTGANLLTLARAGWEVEGIDYVPRAVRQARATLSEAGLPVKIKVADFLTEQRLRVKFDLILDMGCYHSLPPNDKRIYEAKVSNYMAEHAYYYLFGFLKTQSPREGITSDDLACLKERFQITQETRGTGVYSRPSVWLLFRRK